MHTRGTKWQSRRKISLGPVRRACPASGASWNVQVVRGKMTSRCLWHACRALALGAFLMFIGAGMATIGYYAEHINVDSTANVTSNSTKGESKSIYKGIHLHNLSYAGPIVMGCGGFIIVAACVMTFEARDSAAKVVPARFKLSTNTRGNGARVNAMMRQSGTMQAVASQTNRWDNSSTNRNCRPSASDSAHKRIAETAALIHFSRMFGIQQKSAKEQLPRSRSVPNIAGEPSSIQPSTSPVYNASTSKHAKELTKKERHSRLGSPNRGHLNTLHIHRLGTSFDETGPHSHALRDPDCLLSVHSTKKDRLKMSDTAKRHVLSRQKKIDTGEAQNGHIRAMKNRSNSTNSDITNVFRKKSAQLAAVSRARSFDSRGVQTEHSSLDKSFDFGTISKSSTLSVRVPLNERIKSQSTVSSEPENMKLQQLSIDQCLPEENKGATETTSAEINSKPSKTACNSNNVEIDSENVATAKRPDSLQLSQRKVDNHTPSNRQYMRHLYRSNSSSMYKRPTKLSATGGKSIDKSKLINENYQIYFISDNNKNNDNYDSIEVIDERRMTNLSKIDKNRLYKSNTSIYEEYYSRDKSTIDSSDNQSSMVENSQKNTIEDNQPNEHINEEKCEQV